MTAAKGATVKDTVTGGLDYLVIGAIATRDWRHSSYGTKIIKAMQLKEKGRNLAIIAEHHWADLVARVEV